MSSVFLFVILLSKVINCTYGQSVSCKTPSLEEGQCISLLNCDPLERLLRNGPISSANLDLLQTSICGFEGYVPNVCCPLSSNDVAIAQESGRSIESSLLPTTDVCGITSDDKIYGGERANLDEYPWMALIEYENVNGLRRFLCGGVLINSKYVLTAAHCLKASSLPSKWKIVSVRLGEYNTDTEEDCLQSISGFKICAPPAENVAVVERIVHEHYNPNDTNQFHDIALLRLNRDVPFSDFIKPICLPNMASLLTKSYVNKNLVVAGWGKTENRFESNVKLKVQVRVNAQDECSKRYNRTNIQLGDGQLCAGGKKGMDSCKGDSGGPLMGLEVTPEPAVNWYAIGVVSFGPSPCGMENWPGVYTKVAKYMPWIIEKIRP